MSGTMTNVAEILSGHNHQVEMIPFPCRDPFPMKSVTLATQDLFCLFLMSALLLKGENHRTAVQYWYILVPFF